MDSTACLPEVTCGLKELLEFDDRCICGAANAAQSTGGKPPSDGYRGLSFEDLEYSMAKN